jgi:hypothetical protein
MINFENFGKLINLPITPAVVAKIQVALAAKAPEREMALV